MPTDGFSTVASPRPGKPSILLLSPHSRQRLDSNSLGSITSHFNTLTGLPFWYRAHNDLATRITETQTISRLNARLAQP
jgi:hypothetical protein